VKIGARLFLYLSLPLIAIVLLLGFLNLRRSRALIQEELTREGRGIARLAKMAMEDYVRDRQLQDARELVDQITGYERVLGARLFDDEGRILYESRNLDPQFSLPTDTLQRVLRRREPIETAIRVKNDLIVSFMQPLESDQGEPLGAIQILQAESFVDEEARAARASVVELTAIVILLTASVIFVVTRYSVARPIEELVRSLRGVGSGRLGTRLAVPRSDEFGRLAREFNAMGERLETAQRALLAEQEERRRAEVLLRDAERLASVGRLAAGLAHDIGTPLNVIGGRAEALLRRLGSQDPARRNLGIIIAQIERIARTVRGMLDFSRVREPRLEAIQVTQVVGRVLELLEDRLREGSVRVETEFPPGLPRVVADADQLEQVFLNLATNALDAMPQGGTLAIRASRARRSDPAGGDGPREFLAIDLADTGVGIPPENLGRVFDPFFSTKDVGKGTGLGLSISYSIVREHGGFIDIGSEPGRGSRVGVFLPLQGSLSALGGGAEIPAGPAVPRAEAS
jgi:signal transduction histidine kinase